MTLVHAVDVSETWKTWWTATKTKPMLVKHVTAVLSDLSVSPSVLVRTLEGDQIVRPNAFVCRGVAGELWQQETKTLFRKYDVTDCDADGWWVAKPKPGNAVDVTPIRAGDPTSIRAKWGTAYKSETESFWYQEGAVGDYVLRSREDSEDVWIVQKKIFEATYEIVGDVPDRGFRE